MTQSSTRAHDARKHGQEIVSCKRGSVQRKGKESLVRSGIVGKLKIPVFAIMCRVVVEPCSLLFFRKATTPPVHESRMGHP